jgi:hypothetical protein
MRKLLVALAGVLAAGLAMAAGDNALLIQTQPGGGYTVWHADGTTQMSDEEIMQVAAGATPEGSPVQPVSAGKARAFQTEAGVIIEFPELARDRRLLVDRDACGAIKVWHADGETQLTEDQITDLVMAALPGGGRRVNLGDRYAKSFVTPMGYAVVIWAPVRR